MPDALLANIYLEDLPRAGDRALRILQELARQGAEFSDFGPGSEFDAVRRYFEGPNRDFFPFSLEDGRYSLTVLEETPAVLLRGSLNYVDPAKNQALGARALQLLESLLPLCDLRFAFADRQGAKQPPRNEMLAGGLPWLFWANFYGSAAVERWGRDFLLGAPGWRKAELAGGIIEYVLTPDPLAPPDPRLEEDVRSYFAPQLHIERYRPQPIY